MKDRRKVLGAIINPRGIKPESKNISAFVLGLVVIAIFQILLDILLKVLQIDTNRDSFTNISTISLISAIFLAPVVEEIIFRTHLSGKPRHAWSLLTTYAAFVIVTLHNHRGLMFFFIFFTPILFSWLFKIRFLVFVLRKLYNLTFYLTAVLFSLMHLFIVQQDIKMGIASSIIVTLIAFMPVAVVLGIIRKKFGLIAAIIMHSLNNLIVLSFNSLYIYILSS